MTNTNHFNLNKPEGSDLYNHLTIDNPNMDIIDAAMYDNEIHSVGDAAELKSGSVHSITRMNGDTSVFKFTATSDFVAGETFTLDGEQVTVYTTDAQPLPTNAYRIGATVLCAVSGSVVTMYVQAAPAIAQDSEKLGGQLPDYYGKASDVTSAVQTAQAAATVANQANQAANTVSNALTAFKTFSTNEQIVGTWVDGKPIYRISIRGHLSSSDTNREVLVANVPNVNTVIAQDALLKSEVSGEIFSLNTYAGQSYAFSYTKISAGNLYINSVWYGDFVFTIEYTKTTD